MKEIKGTETEKNLLIAFSGESQARNKYAFFASQARKEGFINISKIISEIADNEKEHAKILFEYLNGLSNTISNIESAIKGENFEWSDMYKKFAAVAKNEGFEEISKKFEQIADIEKSHEKKFLELLSEIKNNKVFSCDNEVVWVCANCGHIHFGKKAPEICPVCEHSKSYFKKERS